MFADVDLRQLAELTSPDRAFLSVYLAGPRSVEGLEKRFRQLRAALKGGGPEADEREYFDENARMVRDHLKKDPFESGSLALFACWALDYFQAVPLPVPVEDLVWIDSSPYIRPLAELRDEYENVAVVVADNAKARVYLVSSAVAADEEVLKGDIKNHVKKGGWSQKRYERRRDKELLHYAREIAAALDRLHHEKAFRRIVMVGGKEVLRIIHEELPQALRRIVAEKAVDLKKGEGAVNEDIMDVFTEQERQSERDLWEQVRSEYLRGGLGVVGVETVLEALRRGQADAVVVDRGFRPEGRRCRECEHLDAGAVEACSACGSDSVFEVDLVNEIAELCELTGARIDFTDPIDTLTEAGRIAAHLRYRI